MGTLLDANRNFIGSYLCADLLYSGFSSDPASFPVSLGTVFHTNGVDNINNLHNFFFLITDIDT